MEQVIREVDKIITKYQWWSIYSKQEDFYIEKGKNKKKLTLAETINSLVKRLRLISATIKINLQMENACKSFETDYSFLALLAIQLKEKKKKIEARASVWVMAELLFPVSVSVTEQMSKEEKEALLTSTAHLDAQAFFSDEHEIMDGVSVRIDDFTTPESWNNAITKITISNKDNGDIIVEKDYTEE